MKKYKLLLFSLFGAIVSSAIFIGCSSNKEVSIVKEYNDSVDYSGTEEHTYKDDEMYTYWEVTSIEEIRESILLYIDDMMESTLSKLNSYKQDNDTKKIDLYEREISRLNKISENIKNAITKEDLKEAMQVRHKNSV